jgi:hypothetical protein
MADIAEVFKHYGSKYLELFAKKMPPSHKRAPYDITNCRSGEFGFHLDSCDKCGYTHLFFHSCCNRSCPKCHSNHTKKWLEDKEKLLLPTTYFHLVFTLPQELRLLVRANQTVLLNCLIKAAAYALQKLMADEGFRRFLQHVLPRGFHKVRYYGFFAPAHRDVLHSLKVTLTLAHANKIPPQRLIYYHRNSNSNRNRKCPRCKTGNMSVKIHIFYKKHVILFVRPPP